jgi:hypothetical protein
MPLAVVLAWVVSRALVAVVLWSVWSETTGAPFAAWDGGWYVDIARLGYGFVHPDGKTPYPFFPLLPGILRAGLTLDLPPEVVGVVASHLAFLIALLGLYELTRARFGSAAASVAVWSLALFPGSTTFSMVYPEAIFLAATVWAFVALDRDRVPPAALLATVAALARPNGPATAVALAVAVAMDPARRRSLPWLALPCAGVAAWIAALWSWTGDPLVFLRAKSAWAEVTALSVLSGRHALPTVDTASGAFAVLSIAVAWRRIPAAWIVLAVLWLLPPLVLGILGLPRYVATCFPVFVAVGYISQRVRPVLVGSALAVFAAGLAVLTARIGSGRMMP